MDVGIDCLTTNIIFGITDQSQCKKCKRVIFINISDSDDISEECEALYGMLGTNNNKKDLIANYMNNAYNNFNSLDVYKFVRNISLMKQLVITKIPHSEILNLKRIAEGGFGVVYKATWSDNNVAIKRFFNSQNINKYFLNEVIDIYIIFNI